MLCTITLKLHHQFSPKLIYRFKMIFIKSLAGVCFFNIGKLIPKFTWKCKKWKELIESWEGLLGTRTSPEAIRDTGNEWCSAALVHGQAVGWGRSPHTHPHVCVKDISQKGGALLSKQWVRRALYRNDRGLVHLDPYFTPYTKLNFKWIVSKYEKQSNKDYRGYHKRLSSRLCGQ